MVVAKQKRVAKKKPQETEAPKKAAGKGTAKMKAAADAALGEKCTEIAQALVDKTIAGNSMSARLLFSLAEGQTDCEEQPVAQPLCSLAKGLAAEPEWDGELNEAEAEAGLGSGEPKRRGSKLVELKNDKVTSAAS